MCRPLLSVLLAVLACCLTPPASAAPCVGLVLGGGGARGAAHIGVLKVLERERIPICKIAGTSMGALVGGLYASGYSADAIEQMLTSIDWRDVLSDDPARADYPMRRKNDTLRYLIKYRFGYRDGALQFPRGVIQGQKLLLLLRRLTLQTWQTENFDALPIPFRAVATDIVTGEQVLFKDGDLGLALRASMSVPAAFAPMRVNGRLLVDGGIVNNLPVDVVQAMGADRLIVVDVGAQLAEASALDSPFAVTMQMLDVLMRQRTQQLLDQMDSDDIKILPLVADIGVADFSQSAKAIPLGVAAAEAQIQALRQLSVSASEYQVFRNGRQRSFDPPLISYVDVLTERSTTSGYVERRLDALVGGRLDITQLERAIGGAFALGNYERIDWRPVSDAGKQGIELTPVDKSWGPNFVSVGLQLSDDFEGHNDYQFGLEYTMTGLNRYGGEWRSRLELGRIAGLRTEFFQPLGARGQFYAEPYVEYRASDQPLRLADQQLSPYRVRRAALGFELGYEFAGAMRVYAGLSRSHASATATVGTELLLPRRVADSAGVRLGLIGDTLDDANFPSSGSRGEFSLLLDSSVLGSDGRGQGAAASWDTALSHGANRILFGARAQSIWGRPGVLDALAPLGGFANLSGYSERDLLGAHSVLLRSIYYRRLRGEGKLFSVPAFVGASLEAGNVYAQREQFLSLENLIVAGSVFVALDSPLGPIFLGFGRADTGVSSVFLNFGSLLRPQL